MKVQIYGPNFGIVMGLNCVLIRELKGKKSHVFFIGVNLLHFYNAKLLHNTEAVLTTFFNIVMNDLFCACSGKLNRQMCVAFKEMNI